MMANDSLPKEQTNVTHRNARSRFFPELESARGLAALAVAGFHCSQTKILVADSLQPVAGSGGGWILSLLKWLYEVFVSGSGPLNDGVLFFFVLSGFLLTDSLRRGPDTIRRSGTRFFLFRFFRLYPAALATILVFWAAFSLLGISLDPEGYSTASLLRNMALLQVNIDGVLWTVQVEILALPLIFFAFFVQSRAGIGFVAGMALVLTAGAFWKPWHQIIFDTPSCTRWIFAFFYGIVGYHFGRQRFPRLEEREAALLFLASAGTFFLAGTIIHGVWEIVVEAAAAAVMIGVLAFGPELRVASLLRSAPLRFVGRVSYSFYLLHPLALAVIWKQSVLFGSWAERGVPGILILIALWVATSAAILPLAWLMYRMVEIPFIRIGKSLWMTIENQLPHNRASGTSG